MCRILLIDPPTECNTNAPNVGLAYIGASLKKLNHEVSILDLTREIPGLNVQNPLFMGDVDLVGISVKSHNYSEAKTVTADLNHAAETVWGGAHVTLMKEKLISENPNVDHFVVGEGEHFLDNLKDKMCYMPYIEDLDSLPFPDYKLFNTYSQLLNLSYPLICSRGCPYGCIYCSVPLVSGRKVRYRSVGNCIEEVKSAKEQGFSNVQILDDNFTFDKDFAKAFCREMAKVGLAYHCPNGIRADKFDEELADLMVGSGCYQVSFGVESAHSEVYKNIKKGEKLEDIENAVQIAQKAGLQVNCYFIIGLPGSTFEKDLESLKWVMNHGVRANFGMLVPYIGTQVWDWAQDKITSTRGSHFGKLAYPIFQTSEYPAEDMMDAFLIFNYVTGSGFTDEWYKTNAVEAKPDFEKRLGRHFGVLKGCGVLRECV